VFLLDWGVADERDADNSLETYVDRRIPAAVSAACDAADTDDVTLLGYCFGGLAIACARHHELPDRNLVLLKPTGEISQYANLWENLWNDVYVLGYRAMGQWTRDHVPFPGAAFGVPTDRGTAGAPERADGRHARAGRRAG
jgi:polyhydroxyalkanoate synthase subunit PhaC